MLSEDLEKEIFGELPVADAKKKKKSRFKFVAKKIFTEHRHDDINEHFDGVINFNS